MKKRLLFLMMAFFHTLSFQSYSQPYFDVVSLQGVFTRPTTIFSNEPIGINTDYYSSQLSFPYQFKNKSVLAITAGYDEWQIKQGANILKLQSGYLPVTFIKPLANQWNFSVTGIPRFSNEKNRTFNNEVWQIGGAILATKKFSDRLTLKGGIYYNKEFFGNYFLPLLGGEWRVTDKLILFGLLPNNLFADYKISNSLHAGFIYKGITASFRLKENKNNDYIRLQEGQLKIFADIYITKKLVLNAEFGHTVAREYGFGLLDKKNNKADFNDGYLLKTGIYYRMWL